MKTTHRLILIGIIGFSFGGWFTLDTGGVHAAYLLTFTVGAFISLVMFLIAASIKTDEPHKRFKSKGMML